MMRFGIDRDFDAETDDGSSVRSDDDDASSCDKPF